MIEKNYICSNHNKFLQIINNHPAHRVNLLLIGYLFGLMETYNDFFRYNSSRNDNLYYLR